MVDTRLGPSSSDGTTSGAGSPRRSAEEDNLRSSLDDLAALATGDLSLDQLLAQVAVFAARAIPGADGVGVTVLGDDRSPLLGSSAPFVDEVDDLQYGLGQGPCISAVQERRTMRSGSLGEDPRWSSFGTRAAELGVHSAVSLVLVTSTTVVGALNVYAHAKNVFDERAAKLGERFAVPAAVAVQNASVLARTQRLVDGLQRALTGRAAVDRAVGILMSRNGYTEEQALARLEVLSRYEHQDLPVVAQSVVDEAVRRARRRD